MEARENNNRMRRALRRLIGLCLLGGLLLAFWRYSPIVREWTEPERLGSLLDGLSATPWAGMLVVCAFLIGSFVVFPVTALIAATGIALGPVDGLIWASTGALLGAIVTYGSARALPERTLENWVGPWIGRFGRRFEHGGIVTIMLARNFPFAPFTLINVVAGAARIPFRDYLIGTVLGMGPIIAALTILGDRIRDVWTTPTAENVMLLGLAVLLWFALAFGLQSLSNRWASARLSAR